MEEKGNLARSNPKTTSKKKALKRLSSKSTKSLPNRIASSAKKNTQIKTCEKCEGTFLSKNMARHRSRCFGAERKRPMTLKTGKSVDFALPQSFEKLKIDLTSHVKELKSKSGYQTFAVDLAVELAETLTVAKRNELIKKLTGKGPSRVESEQENLPLQNIDSMVSIPNVNIDDVVGMDYAKEVLLNGTTLQLCAPQLFHHGRVPWTGVLLFGPPGTGKTFLAEAVAKKGNFTFFAVKSSELLSSWVGESEKSVASLFAAAHEKKPSIIFIDEADAFCAKRKNKDAEHTKSIKQELLVRMDGSDGVLVLGATNIPWTLDVAFRSRFQKHIYIGLPEAGARMQMFKKKLSKNKHCLEEKDFETLAQLSEGFSARDIKGVVQSALMDSVDSYATATHFKKVGNRSINSPSGILFKPCSPLSPGATKMSLADIPKDKHYDPPVTMAHMRQALLKSKPSVTAEDLRRLSEYANEHGND